MRFSHASLLAVPALVTADALSDLFSEFNTISATDTSAFNQWVQSYAQVADTYYHSVYSEVQSQIGNPVTSDASFDSSLRAQISSITANYDYSDFYAEIHTQDNFSALGGDGGDFSDPSGLSSELAAASSIIQAEESSLSRAESVQPSASITQTSEASVLENSSKIFSVSRTSSAAVVSETESSRTSKNSASSFRPSMGSSAVPAFSESATVSRSSTYSAGIGGQEPMLIGAALVGISVLLL